MINCKECGKSISDKADPCPQCGVPEPAFPYELERLIKEKEKLYFEENYHADMYSKLIKELGRFPWYYRFLPWENKRLKQLRTQVHKHTDLANAAQKKVIEKDDEIYQFHMKS